MVKRSGAGARWRMRCAGGYASARWPPAPHPSHNINRRAAETLSFLLFPTFRLTSRRCGSCPGPASRPSCGPTAGGSCWGTRRPIGSGERPSWPASARSTATLCRATTRVRAAPTPRRTRSPPCARRVGGAGVWWLQLAACVVTGSDCHGWTILTARQATARSTVSPQRHPAAAGERGRPADGAGGALFLAARRAIEPRADTLLVGSAPPGERLRPGHQRPGDALSRRLRLGAL